MPTAAQIRFLEERGWAINGVKPYDLCWLDCSRDGWLRLQDTAAGGKTLAICLCPEHAVLLEEGRYHGDYDGAPLPPDSIADEWPWQYFDLAEGERA